MWRLVIEDDEGAHTLVPLHREAYSIGRGAGNAIRLTDRNVSREHAVFRRLAGSYEVEDLDSYSGTYLNGARINVPRALAAGDIVQLGDYVIAIELDATGEPYPISTKLPPSARSGVARLVVIDSEGRGKEYALDRDELVVGRDDGADIPLLDASVSRRHCRLIHIDGERFDVTDLGSANGISINGVELGRGVIEPGDTLQVGDVRLRCVAAGEVFWSNPSAERSRGKRRLLMRIAVSLLLVLVVIAVVILLRRR